MFSADVVKTLTEAWANRKNIKIKVVNCYGEKFTTIGRVATGDNNQIILMT